MTDKRSVYEDECTTELSQWDAQFILLMSKADKADMEMKTDCLKALGALQHKQEEAKAKHLELKAAGKEAWEDLKTVMEKIRMDLRISFCRVAAKLE